MMFSLLLASADDYGQAAVISPLPMIVTPALSLLIDYISFID